MKPLSVCWMGFLGQNHSWSIVGQSICRELVKMGHKVDMFSTNGDTNFPQDLRPSLKGSIPEKHKMDLNQLNQYAGRVLQPEYDVQLSYTAPKNWPFYFVRGNKNRLAIWCYEMAGTGALPIGFAKNYHYVDRIMPPSKFAEEVFLQSKVPQDMMTMIPHGFNSATFLDGARGSYPLKTKKRFKILANIAQPHIRKNLPGLLNAYGKAFTKKDDVCLVLKVVDKIPSAPFEVSFRDVYNIFETRFRNHGEVEIITDFITDIDKLYRSCDALFSLTHSECFHLPSLEALSVGIIPIISGWGGQLDFLNDKNALLVSGREIPVPIKAFYWGAQQGAYYFDPDVNEAAEKLRYAYNNTEKLKEQVKNNSKTILADYTWENVTRRVLELVK